jgi:ParB-like chromosome segregation protein Spo0J
VENTTSFGRRNENVHRKDLEPIEKGKGLAEVYKLMGFNPMKIAGMLGKHMH